MWKAVPLCGRKETSREKRNAKYGFCWRSEILVLKKASKLNKLPALSRWHLLGYFLSFFLTVFLFFTGISSFWEQMVWGTCAHWRGPPLQGFFERGGGERRTTASACERSRGGVNERGVVSIPHVHRDHLRMAWDASGEDTHLPTGPPSLMLTELCITQGFSFIDPRVDWPSYASTLELSWAGERKDPEVLIITGTD